MGIASRHDKVQVLSHLAQQTRCIGIASVAALVVQQTEMAAKLVWQECVRAGGFRYEALVEGCHDQRRRIVKRQFQPAQDFDGLWIGTGRNGFSRHRHQRYFECLHRRHLGIQGFRQVEKRVDRFNEPIECLMEEAIVGVFEVQR